METESLGSIINARSKLLTDSPPLYCMRQLVSGPKPRAWRAVQQMSSGSRAFAVVLVVLAFAQRAVAAESLSGTLELDPAKTLVEFHLPGTLHTTHGKFKLVHGTIRADLATGEASGSVVVDARSGDTGIGARDNEMRESVLEAQRYPTITFEPRHVTGQLGKDGQLQGRLQGILTIHGAEHEIVVDVQGRLVGDNLVARTHFSVPYVEWGMEDPSVLFLTVAKKVDIDIATSGNVVWTGDSARRSHQRYKRICQGDQVFDCEYFKKAHPRTVESPSRGCQLWLSNVSTDLAHPTWSRKTLYFQCRGRDSNPHGAFAPEDFKSSAYAISPPRLLSAQGSLNHKHARARRRCFGPDAP
jgi:polyisoprenoid-binding protein YceI